MKRVMGMMNHFDTVHFHEVEPWKNNNCQEFLKKIINIIKTPHLTHVPIKERMSDQQNPDESVLE